MFTFEDRDSKFGVLLKYDSRPKAGGVAQAGTFARTAHRPWMPDPCPLDRSCFAPVPLSRVKNTEVNKICIISAQPLQNNACHLSQDRQ